MNPALQPLMLPRDALRPPSADSPRVGVALSVLAHVGLIAALALGVQWRTDSPEGVEAELWAAVPQIAAPAATATESPQDSSPPPAPAVQDTAPPPPPPTLQRAPEPSQREADLAEERERERQQRLEQERREAQDRKARERREQQDREREAAKEKREQQQREEARAEKARQDKARDQQARQQAQAQAKQEASAQAAREKARQDQLRRMNAQLGGTGAPDAGGTAARDAGPSANYAGRIKARIRPNIVLIDPVSGNPQAEAELRVAPDGSIVGRRLTQPSGNSAWDEAVLRAIDRTGMLPRDVDGRVPSRILITFRPQD